MGKINRALISVSDKTDVVWFASELSSMGVEIISTGGTYKLLSQNNIKATPVAEVTGFPEMLDGRVKTLHPKVHAGILADRSNKEHMRQLEYQKILPIDLVAVNLYPFEETISKPDVKFEEAIEQIDIGGPTMVRAAAKNHAHVAVVVNPTRYREVISEMAESGGQLSDATKRRLALEAFAHTASYDSMIASYLSGVEGEKERFPREMLLSLKKELDLRYGENPHQMAAFYREAGASGPVTEAKRLTDAPLSFNNILDAEAAWQGVVDFTEPACVIIKHNNPCGVALGETPREAYLGAYECDSVSAFGSVIAFNHPVDEETAFELKELFVEVLLAPSCEPGALELLKKKKGIRILEVGKWEASGEEKAYDMRRIRGGLLLQDYDSDMLGKDSMKVVTKTSPTDSQWEDLLFAWKVCRHVKSNAIVFAKSKKTVGIGAGQMSRVDSVTIASIKAGEKALDSVMASDAF
ncbi:MAG: bifunctional phosphoribosylaminoimidazolecarboxamide formyltransferase/IMP cyclohydrolase, partial [Actinomycetota bacterium]|nr:bifunctional phosphoribosylaminoimidazolecarboxamide formyltransferase/IMP cyclohydrolase [Actinomycetota bacterium]